MRLRSAVLLSSLALAALALSGCSGDPAPESTPSSTATEGAFCDVAIQEGADSDGLKVTGEYGELPALDGKVEVSSTTPSRTVLTEGDGPKVGEGDWVEASIAIFDASTGDLAQSGGFDGHIPAMQAVAQSAIGQLAACTPVGSRIAATVPGTEQAPAVVYVIDVNKIVDMPTRAWGDDQAPVDGQPTVKLDDKGAPTITLPKTDAPKETVVTTLKKGDGAKVAAGSDVVVQYTGVKWSDGSVFDSSWERGTPAPFNTAQVVPGFTKAIEGQTVGSQVLVTMPPKDGYGEGEKTDDSLVGETLTFVVDILDAGAWDAIK